MPVIFEITNHALQRWRQRFGCWGSSRSYMLRWLRESRPLNIQEKRDLQDVLGQRMKIRLTETVLFYEPMLAVFFGSATPSRWVVTTCLKLEG
jgi:hypothetical protein